MITFSSLGLMGQLGNQMFQYGILLELQERFGYEAKIPYRFRGLKRRRVELDCFRIKLPALQPCDHQQIINRFQEDQRPWDQTIDDVKDNTDLWGYFQSFKYFKLAAERIRREFTFVPQVESVAVDLMRAIRRRAGGRPICGVHVRRGDYLMENRRKPNCRQVLTAEQVRTLKQELVVQGVDGFFIIASDDISWCRQQLGGNNYFLEGTSHFVDLCVLSLCDHLIMACSSFSWWAAYLRDTPEKIRICPEIWNARSNIESRNICLPHWKTVALQG